MANQGNQAEVEPLLQTQEEGDVHFNGQIIVGIAIAHSNSSTREWREEVKAQMRIAGPLVYANLLQYGMQLISVMLIGHLDRLALSSVSIASSFANVTGFSVLVGMASGLETQCGQAYGAKQYWLVGIFLQRAIFVLSLISIPLAFLWANVETLLLALGQEPDIAHSAGEYDRWLIPGLFAYAVSQPLLKFLQVQSLVMPIVVCASLALCFHGPICWVLVFKVGLGHRGAAIATSLSNWVNVASLLAYVCFSPTCRHTRPSSLSLDSLKDLSTYLKLATPAAFMLCLEWWSYEILLLLSGLLPDPEISSSTLSIMLNTAILVFTVPWSLGAAVSTRVSNELGAGYPRAARMSMYVSMGLTAVASLVISTILFCLRNLLGRAYTNDKEVVVSVANIMPLLAISSIFDALQSDASGVVRGCGLQKVGAFVNLGCFYAVGLPAAFILAFPFQLGDKGLWMGISCGSMSQAIALSLIVLSTNWDKQAMKAASRIKSNQST